MSPRWREHGDGQATILLHPTRPRGRPCRLLVCSGGLVVRPQAVTGGRTRDLRVPWWAVRGFGADGTAPGEDGRWRQVLEVVTDAGTLSFLCPADGVSVLLAQVGWRSAGWRRARRPLRASLARASALSAPLVRLAAVLGIEAFGGLGLSVAAAVRTAVRAATRLACRRPVVAGATGMSTAAGIAFLVLTLAGAQTVPALPAPAVARASEAHAYDALGMAQLALAGNRTAVRLAAASGPPPALASLDAQPPLPPHEVFGFAPYWTLDQSTAFDVHGLTTIAYFALDVNADGTLVQSGPGWEGYQSQALADLVARAHAAGDRVVLTVDDFSQPSLDQLTSSSQAAATLASAVVSAVQAKNLDGVNLDFEGQGSGDQAGLTRLVGTVSAAVHAADPHYQVTMDTYASAAGDPTGFYDIRALAPEVDGFFVMAYDLNLDAAPSADSPLTSVMFSDRTALEQYTAAVPAAKVVLGLPYYGYDWPTTNGTMSAEATGTPTPVATGQILSSGHTLYWDPVTETAWTAYQAGGQWHEDHFMDPTSLYLATEMAQSFGVAGVGAWALGMDGNDPAVLSALDGVEPPVDAVPGPLGTPGAVPPSATVPVPVVPPVLPGSPPVTSPPVTSPPTTAPPPSTTTTTTTTTAPPPSTTTTTTTTTTVPTAEGVFEGRQVALTELTGAPPGGTTTHLGTLTGFTTTDPSLSCLSRATGLPVQREPTGATEVVATTPADCVAARFAVGG